MAHHSGHHRHSKTAPSDHLHLGNLSIAPALTKSEHLSRIVEWTRSTDPASLTASTDDAQTVAHSLLIDDGVRRLRNWDNEMKLFGNDKNDEHGGRISESTKLNLIADLNNIKQTVDPDDTITPRIIVQEFQKFMDSKKSAEPRRNKKNLGDSVVDKRVQFQSPKEREEVGERDKRQKALNVGFTVTYPGRPTPAKGIKADIHTKQREPSPNKDPDWWRRKIRQGFIQTDEMMSKLVGQRKQEEQIIHGIGTEGFNNGPSSAFQYHPKTYASIAERATRNERQRLDMSMERLRKRHEECFGACTVPKDTAAEAADVQKKHKSHTNQQTPVSHAVNTRFDEGPTKSAPPKPERNDRDEYADKINKLMALGIPNPNKQAYPPRKNAPEKETKKLNSIFKAHTASKKSTFLKAAEVQVIYERQSDGHHLTNHEASSDHKMGSERWPQEYLKIRKAESVRPAAHSLSHNQKSGNSEWVKRFVEAHKNKIIKDEAEHKVTMDKRKAEKNAMYQELLFNQNRLQHEVDMERRRMQMSWKFSSPAWQRKDNNKDKLPDRFQPYAEDVENHKAPKEPLKYTWKEQPKGLNMWLEGVMAKAKDDREAKDKRKQTNAIVPLSSYQF